MEQGCGIGQGVAKYRSVKPTLLQDVVRLDGRVQRVELVVIRSPEKSEGCDHRAGAHPRHQFEGRDRTGIRPAAKEPRAKGAVVATARDCQKIYWGEPLVATSLACRGAFSCKRRLSLGDQCRTLCIRPK